MNLPALKPPGPFGQLGSRDRKNDGKPAAFQAGDAAKSGATSVGRQPSVIDWGRFGACTHALRLAIHRMPTSKRLTECFPDCQVRR
jgi:hypothetical protein